MGFRKGNGGGGVAEERTRGEGKKEEGDGRKGLRAEDVEGERGEHGRRRSRCGAGWGERERGREKGREACGRVLGWAGRLEDGVGGMNGDGMELGGREECENGLR